MNGRALRIAACTASALLAIAPASAFARKHHAQKTATKAPAPFVVVPHDYLAGGNGAPLQTFGPGQVRLFDPLQLAQNLGNQVLTGLGLPALPTL